MCWRRAHHATVHRALLFTETQWAKIASPRRSSLGRSARKSGLARRTLRIRVTNHESLEALSQALVLPNLTLPNLEDLPPLLSQCRECLPIPLLVARDLGGPIINIRLWCRCELACVAVPKAAVHAHNLPVFWQDDVGTSRQLFPVKAEAIPETMQHGANSQLGLRILRADAAHERASLLLLNRVHKKMMPALKLSLGSPTFAIAGCRGPHIATGG